MESNVIKIRIQEIIGHEITEELMSLIAEFLVEPFEKFITTSNNADSIDSCPILRIFNPQVVPFLTTFNLLGNSINCGKNS